MKWEVKRVETPPAFQPVELTLRFETAEELAAFYAVFSYSNITGAIGRFVAHSDIRDSLKAAIGRIPDYQTHFDSIRNLCRISP